MPGKKPTKQGRALQAFTHRPTGEKYYLTVNIKRQKEEGLGKLVLRKYSRKLRKVVEFKQDKL